MREQLLDLIYDLLPEDQAVTLRRRLESDAALQPLYQALLQESQWVTEAARLEPEKEFFCFPQTADSNVTGEVILNSSPGVIQYTHSGHPRKSGFRLIAQMIARRTFGEERGIVRMVSVLAMSLVFFTFFGLLFQRGQLKQLQLSQQSYHLRIAAPPVIAEGEPQVVQVQVADLAGYPQQVPVHFAVNTQQGKSIYSLTKETDSDGNLLLPLSPLTLPYSHESELLSRDSEDTLPSELELEITVGNNTERKIVGLLPVVESQPTQQVAMGFMKDDENQALSRRSSGSGGIAFSVRQSPPMMGERNNPREFDHLRNAGEYAKMAPQMPESPESESLPPMKSGVTNGSVMGNAMGREEDSFRGVSSGDARDTSGPCDEIAFSVRNSLASPKPIVAQESINVPMSGVPSPSTVLDSVTSRSSKLSSKEESPPPDLPVELAVGQTDFPAGEPVRIRLRSKREMFPVAVTLSREGIPLQSVTQLLHQGQNTLEIPLPEDVEGQLEVTVFNGTTADLPVLAGQTVFRHPKKHLEMKYEHKKSDSPDGEWWNFEVQVIDEQGNPVPNAVVEVNIFQNEPVPSQNSAVPPSENLSEEVLANLRPVIYDNLSELQEKYGQKMQEFQKTHDFVVRIFTLTGIFGGMVFALFVTILAMLRLVSAMRMFALTVIVGLSCVFLCLGVLQNQIGYSAALKQTPFASRNLNSVLVKSSQDVQMAEKNDSLVDVASQKKKQKLSVTPLYSTQIPYFCSEQDSLNLPPIFSRKNLKTDDQGHVRFDFSAKETANKLKWRDEKSEKNQQLYVVIKAYSQNGRMGLLRISLPR
jgi:hypothetical protein